VEFTKKQLKQIEHCFPRQRGNVGVSNLQVLNAVLYVAEHGCKWRGLPKRFGNWNTIYYTRLKRWSKKDVPICCNLLALGMSCSTIGLLSGMSAARADTLPRMFRISAPSSNFQVMLGNDDVSGNVYCASYLSETEGRLTVLPVEAAESLNGPPSASARDLLFIDERGRIVVLILNAPPHLENGGPGQAVSVLARDFIELAPGQAWKLQLRVGDQLRLPHLHGAVVNPRPPCVQEVR